MASVLRCGKWGEKYGLAHGRRAGKCHASRVRTLFVTGLAGYLGSELARRCAGAGWRVSGTVNERPGPAGVDTHRVDVRDEEAVRRAIDAERPDAVVHTAYRRGGEEAESVNVAGARAVAEAAAGLRLVHLSTDLVFGGALGRPLTEEDQPDPVLDYGRFKAQAEELVLDAHPDALVVRTSLIYGDHRPSEHERLALAAAEGEDIAFFTDELRNPIEVGDLAEAILELLDQEVSGPLHVAGSEAVNRLELAELMVARRGRDPRVLEGGPGGSSRPKDCRLDCSRAEPLLGTRLRGVREVLAAP
jgi:dTDP-4-dehydrorhamnose reductase